VEIEWLILADSAQVVGNKLYLLGGGWDRIPLNKDVPQHFAIAIAVKVPWGETNKRHTFELEVLSEDQNTEEVKSLAKMGGQFEVGRPVGIPAGRDQRIQLAIEMGLKIDHPGTKKVVASIDGAVPKELLFDVVPIQNKA
jgi:hypothetical protein